MLLTYNLFLKPSSLQFYHFTILQGQEGYPIPRSIRWGFVVSWLVWPKPFGVLEDGRFRSGFGSKFRVHCFMICFMISSQIISYCGCVVSRDCKPLVIIRSMDRASRHSLDLFELLLPLRPPSILVPELIAELPTLDAAFSAFVLTLTLISLY